MKQLCLHVYELFNASLQPLAQRTETHAYYSVVDQNGKPCIQAHIDKEKKQFVLRFAAD
jgi:hypothetical protein